MEAEDEVIGENVRGLPSFDAAPSQREFTVTDIDKRPKQHRMDRNDTENEEEKEKITSSEKAVSRSTLDEILDEFKQDALEAVADANHKLRHPPGWQARFDSSQI